MVIPRVRSARPATVRELFHLVGVGVGGHVLGRYGVVVLRHGRLLALERLHGLRGMRLGVGGHLRAVLRGTAVVTVAGGRHVVSPCLDEAVGSSMPAAPRGRIGAPVPGVRRLPFGDSSVSDVHESSAHGHHGCCERRPPRSSDLGRPGRRLEGGPRARPPTARARPGCSRSSRRAGTATRRSAWCTATSRTCCCSTPRCRPWTASRRCRRSSPSARRRRS